MHCIPLISVEAASHDEAVEAAENALDQYQNNAWDYHQPDTERYGGQAAIRYIDDPTRFLAELDRCRVDERQDLDSAIREMQTQMESLRLLLKGELGGPSECRSLGYVLYGLGELLTRSSDFEFGSLYYDGIEEESGDYDAVRERCQQDPESQWLVAMDLHF